MKGRLQQTGTDVSVTGTNVGAATGRASDSSLRLIRKTRTCVNPLPVSTSSRIPVRPAKIITLLLLLAVHVFAQTRHAARLARYVNPFVGTGGHGHTFPGAALPFGMVQLSPDTRLTGWDGCSGYHYSDRVIYGFSHTHLSGTGISDYGDVLLMPTVGPVYLNARAEGGEAGGYASRFSHRNEVASPGYYSVRLDDSGVRAELTATSRAAMHRYTFPATESATVIPDLAHR